MHGQNRWMRWSAIIAFGAVAGACGDQTPTGLDLSPDAASLSVAAAGAPAKVNVFPAALTLRLGEVRQLTALPAGANGQFVSIVGRRVTWTSSNPSVAAVSATGVVTPKTGGTVRVTASIDGTNGAAVITVNAPAGVASVEIAAPSQKITAGASAQLLAVPKDAAGKPVSGFPISWTSSNPAVATVASNGLVQGVRAGTTVISATVGGKTAKVTITITAPVVAPPQKPAPERPTPANPAPAKPAPEKPGAERPSPAPGSGIAQLSVFPSVHSMVAGQVRQASALPFDAVGKVMSLVGKRITWTSSNPAVATVSATGVVTGRSAGMVTITAELDGVRGSATFSISTKY